MLGTVGTESLIEFMVLFGILTIALIGIGMTVVFLLRHRVRQAQSSVPPRESRALLPDSNFVECDGALLHYVQAGRGPDLVLIHGIGASVYIWRFLFPLLENHFRVTALDLPGFGKSSKDVGRDYGLDAQTKILRVALKQLNISRPILAGSSMGGAIALWLAKSFPEEFKNVVALAPATDHKLAPSNSHRLGMLTPVWRRALNRRTMGLILRRVVARPELISREVIDSYLSPFQEGATAMQTFWQATRLIADPRLPMGLFGLEARVLIIYGDQDRMVPKSVMHRLTGILPNATLLTHEGGGHHIMEDEPEWTADAIVKFASVGNR